MTVQHYNCRPQDYAALRRAQQHQTAAERDALALLRQRNFDALQDSADALNRADKMVGIATLIVGPDVGVDWLPIRPAQPLYDRRGKETAKGREVHERYEREREAAMAADRERTEKGVPERISLARLAFGDELVDEVLKLGTAKEEGRDDGGG